MARWSKGSAVRREDQFTAAPGFLDEHESRHLPSGRFSAAWHGMAPWRRVLLAASIVALSMAGGLGIFTSLDAIGGEAGTQPHASNELAAEDGADPGLAGAGDVQGIASEAPDALNATRSDPGRPPVPPP